jgi:hypothetical protein
VRPSRIRSEEEMHERYVRDRLCEGFRIGYLDVKECTTAK